MRNEAMGMRRVISVLCLVVAVASPFGRRADAEDYTWRFPKSGDFWYSDNWLPTGTPNTIQDAAIFDVSGEYVVRFNGSDLIVESKCLEVSSGIVKFDLGYNSSAFERRYRLVPPATMFTTAARIGTTSGPQAQLVIGRDDNTYSGTVEAEGALVIGYAPLSNGRLDIGDLGSDGMGLGNWTSTYPTVVGMNGTGSLFVNCGTLADGGTIIGQSTDAVGEATIHTCGNWTNNGSLVVGANGDGLLSVGGNLTTEDDAYIGRFAGSSGAVTATKSLWSINGNFYLGGDDAGSGGTGELVIDGVYANVVVAGNSTIWPTGELQILDGNMDCESDLMVNDGSVIIHGGSLNVAGQINATPGSIDLSGGSLRVSTLAGLDASVLNWAEGELSVTDGSFRIDVGEPFGFDMAVDGDRSLSVPHNLRVGPYSNGTMLVTKGATVTCGKAFVGSLYADSLQASVVLDGTDTNWTINGNLEVRGAVSSNLSILSGATVSNDNAYLAAEPGTNASVNLHGILDSVLWDCAGDLYAGGDESSSQGSSTIQVKTDSQLVVGGRMKIWDDSILEINGGSVDTHNLNVSGEVIVTDSGNLDVSGGMLDINDGGRLDGSVWGDLYTDMILRDNETSWSTDGSLVIAAADAGLDHVGALTVEDGADLTVEENVTVFHGQRLALLGGRISAKVIDMLDQNLIGRGTLNGEFTTTGSVTATGPLTVGDIETYDGVVLGGSLYAGQHHVTLNKQGTLTIGGATNISGGVLEVPNGIALPTGKSIAGYGVINARIAAQIGSTIQAEGDLSLGYSGSPAGFITDGDLVVNDNMVTVEDSNGADLGAMTWLGTASAPGALVASNGLVLAGSDNVQGFGVIDTPDDPMAALLNDGSIAGDSASERIELAGFVKGMGSLDNVTILGTDSPGYAGPVMVYRGSVDYAGTLVIEVGGLYAGSAYDQINHSGAAGLGGELRVEPINGFQPGVGDSFTIMTYTGHAGEFDTLSLPALETGLSWRVEYGASEVTLSVSERIVGDCDMDGDVDLDDCRDLADCLAGPEGGVLSGCECYDLDSSGSVDLADYALFQGVFTGAQ